MYIPKHFTLPPLTKTKAYNSNKYLTNKYLPITINQVKRDFLNKYEFIPTNKNTPKREFAYFELKQIGGLNKRYFDRKLTLTKWDNQARSYKTLSNSLQYWALNSSQKLTKISNVSEFSTKAPNHQYLQSGNRNLSNSSNSGRAMLGKLESEANQDPNDLNKQLKFYRELLTNNYYDLIINRFETYQLACNLEILQIYIKCLVTTNQTSNLANKVVQAIRTKPDLRGYFESADGDTIINNLLGSSHGGGPLTNGANGSTVSLGSIGQSGAQGGASGRKGDKFAPIHVVVEQPKGAALWKTLKSFGLTLTYIFCILTFLSLALDNSGLAKPPSTSPEYEAETSNSVKFDDVQGVDEAKQELVELVEFLKDPAKFTSLGGKLPKGVLLTGPPGTGKTLLARAVAGQAGVPFFFMSGSEFDEMYVGVGARRVRELFAAARRKAPSIVFIDELDAIGARRNPKDQSYMKQTLNQLLVDLDGFSQTEGVIFIAATNFPDLLDKALTRPGRFDRHVHVPNPDVRGRLQILKLHSSKIQLADDVNLERIARGTIGFSGADLANLVNLAAIEAAKKSSKNVTTVHFEFAKDRIIMGAERKSAVITEESKRMTAYHEGGHALVAYFTEGAMPLHKATVIPRGQSLGMVVQLPEMDKNSFSKKEYRARLDVCMGGRVAEELIYGKDNVSSGAQSDLQQATDIARGMIISFGMSDKVGPVEYSNHLNSLSQHTKQLIEDETKRMLTESYERAKQLLITKRPELERLAKALVEKETLNLEEIESVIASN